MRWLRAAGHEERPHQRCGGHFFERGTRILAAIAQSELLATLARVAGPRSPAAESSEGVNRGLE